MDIIKIVLFILALSFQISGAILLIIKYWGKTRQRIINEYYPGTGIASNDGENNAVLDANRVRECATGIYANRMAFVFIAIGYALSIFGEKGNAGNIVVLFSTAVTTTILVIIEGKASKLIAKKLYQEDIVIPYDELPDYIDRTLSKKDVDDIIGNLYK